MLVGLIGPGRILPLEETAQGIPGPGSPLACFPYGRRRRKRKGNKLELVTSTEPKLLKPAPIATPHLFMYLVVVPPHAPKEEIDKAAHPFRCRAVRPLPGPLLRPSNHKTKQRGPGVRKYPGSKRLGGSQVSPVTRNTRQIIHICLGKPPNSGGFGQDVLNGSQRETDFAASQKGRTKAWCT